MRLKKLKTPGLIIGMALAVLLASPTPASIVVGTVIVCIGEAIRIWAAGHLMRKQVLATSGPYAYVRDPLYLGRFFLVIGFCVMGWGYCLLLLPVALGIFFLSYMPRKYQKEMKWLEDLFGEEYRRYVASVKSLIPRLTPYPYSDRKRWSFSLLWHENREQYFLLIVLAVFAGMIVKYSFSV
nr:isoprenylcysteine carboxylmethyltransferase family protein [Deltaproteobacteria bacterium]